MIPRQRPHITSAWQDYQEACEKLSKMRGQYRGGTELALEMQLQHCEKLLQNWIELTQHFTATLN